MKKKIIYMIGYALLLVLLVVLATMGLQGKNTKQEDLSAAEFTAMLKEGKFSYVLIANKSTAYCVTKENPNKIDLTKERSKLNDEVMKKYEYRANVSFNDDFTVLLDEAANLEDEALRLTNGYDYTIITTPWYVEILPYVFFAILMLGVMYFIYQQTGAGGKAAQFGRSTAKIYDDSKKKITFNDVAGADEEKEELAEIVGFLKNPEKYTKMGARIPKGVLLVGPPGTGKTLLAKSVAGEAGVPFYSITGSDFVELYVGIGAARVRDLFGQAKRNSPCIIFIDEIDAVGRRRGTGIGGGHDEREQTLNQLLVEMDGFVGNEGIIVMAATNRADVLDPALLRSGRFDRQVHVLPPDTKGREDIFKIHARNKHFASDVSAHEVALLTSGFVGADIENLCNEAALLAVRRNKDEIGMQEIKDAITRVILGPEKKSHKISDKAKKLVAYHEAGHAIIARSLEHCDPVTEVSIIPRGGAGGYTMTRPEEENDTYSRGYFVDSITMSFGGRAAERLILGDVSTGASGDIRHATELAKNYVTKYGMADDIGPIYLGDSEGEDVFLGLDFSAHKTRSEALAAKIDNAVQSLIKDADAKATEILKEKEQILHNLAEVLLEMEKITGPQFEEIYNGKTLADFKAEEAAKDEQPAESQPQDAAPAAENKKSNEDSERELPH